MARLLFAYPAVHVLESAVKTICCNLCLRLLESAWRKQISDTNLPKIPVTPIGYVDAVKYLSKMDGEQVQNSWKGGLNITYRYGPGFRAPHNER